MSVRPYLSIEYDPNRSARIALLYYVDGAKAYIIAPNGLEVGATVVSGPDVAPELGNALPLRRPSQRERPALPERSRECSLLPTTPIVALQAESTLRVSPEGNLIIA